MIPTANRHPNSFTMILQWLRHWPTIYSHLISSYTSPPRTADTRMSCYHWVNYSGITSQILLFCFCRCALYLEGTPPYCPLSKIYFLQAESFYNSLSRRVTAPPLESCHALRFLRQISLVWHLSVPVCNWVTGFKLLKDKGLHRTPVFPQLLPTYFEWSIWIFNVGE